MKPLVSLVTPIYNAMPWFRDYLSSVLAQTWRPLELIAVDDNSTDGSYEYLSDMQGPLEAAGIRIRVLRVPHGGQAAAVSAALPLVAGEFFTWCDADDMLTPDSVEKKAAYLIAHPELGMVRSDGFVVVTEKQKIMHATTVNDRCVKNIFDELFHMTSYCYDGYMLRTRLLFDCYPEKRIPLSPEGQNLQLLLPPASRTECGFIPDMLFRYYIRSGGHSSRRRSYTEQLARIENFAKLRAAILPYCDCDQEHYRRENERIRQSDRQKLLYSTLIRAREEMSQK